MQHGENNQLAQILGADLKIMPYQSGLRVAL